MRPVVVLMTLILAGSLEIHSADAAGIRKGTRSRVDAAVGTVWFDSTVGKPVVSFPLGCTNTSCHYAIWMEYVPAGSNPRFTDIFDAEPGEEMLNMDRCFAWVRAFQPILPLRATVAHHFLPGSPIPSNDSMLGGGGRHPARTPGSGPTEFGITDVGSHFVGRNYEYLAVPKWWLELTPGNCLMGLRACYHPQLKVFETQALRCPLSE
jgi:hypothetical protein